MTSINPSFSSREADDTQALLDYTASEYKQTLSAIDTLNQEIDYLRDANANACKSIIWSNEKISALQAEASVLRQTNSSLMSENAQLKVQLEQATLALEVSAPEDPDALRIWANRVLLTAPFLAAVAFGTATIGGIAASLGVSAVAINELTRAR